MMVCLVSTDNIYDTITCSSYAAKIVHQTQVINQHFDGTLNYLNPMTYHTDISDNKSYNSKEMLRQEDKSEFIKAMLREIQDHEVRKH